MKTDLKLSSSALLLALLLVMVVGCNSNPTLSPAGYQQALALFNTCSRQDEEALEKVQVAITGAQEKAEVSDAEAKLMLGLIAKAKAGQWESATARLRTLIESQAIAAPTKPSASGTNEPRQRHRH